MQLEIGLMMHMLICKHKYFTRPEINRARLDYDWPPGAGVPEFGKYVEEGATGGVPRPAGKVLFTAAQCRHWLEHGTIIMDNHGVSI